MYLLAEDFFFEKAERSSMKRCQPLTKAISGFSLIEITIASVLIAGIGIFMSNILVQGFKGQKNASANLDFNTKMAEVLRVIQDATQCNSVQNLIFKQASGTILNPAKLSREDSPSINTVNWIGYQVRSGSNIQNIKIIQEGDTLESTYTVSEIKFQRLKDFATGDVIAASTTGSTTTHPVELVISATPSSGAGIPINKSFKITLFTETASTSPSNNVVGCAQSSAPQITTAPQIITPNGQFPLNFNTCPL